MHRLSAVTTPAERRVAEFFISAGPTAAAMSAREIAEAVGTSDATVLRATKTLGFASLRELRRTLSEEARDPDLTTRLHATIDGSGSPHDVLSAAIDQHLQALDLLSHQVRIEDFDVATAALSGAAHVWWCGNGPSAHLAEYAAFLSRRMGLDAGALTHSGTDLADELLAIRGDHCIVILAYGRLHAHVRVILQHAAALGAQVVFVTDTLDPGATLPLTVRLSAGRGVPGRFASHATTVVLIEALVLAIAAEDPHRSDGALRAVNELRHAIAGKRLDVDPA